MAGFSAGKWKVQILKLKNDLSRLEKQKSQAINDLGKLAWDSKVFDDAYTDVYAQLEALDGRRGQTQTDLTALQSDLQAQVTTQTQLKSDFSARINEWEKKKSAVVTRLNQAQTAHKSALDRASKTKKQQQRVQADLDNAQRKISQLNTSTASDKEAQIAAINIDIAKHQNLLTENAALIPTMDAEVERLVDECPPIQREVQEHEQQISKLQQEMREALAPVDAKIKSLNEKIREGNQLLLSLADQMKPLIAKLGVSASQVRPQAPVLEKAYAQIDSIQNNINLLTIENNQYQARIDATDKSTMRNFYLTLAGAFFSFLCLIGAVIILPTAIRTTVSSIANHKSPVQSSPTLISDVGENQEKTAVSTAEATPQNGSEAVVPADLPDSSSVAKVTLVDVKYVSKLSEYQPLAASTTEADEGWQYVIVVYAIENTSDLFLREGTASGVGRDFIQFEANELATAEGNTYFPTISRGFHYEGILPPGYRVKLTTAFMVPQNQTGLTLRFTFDDGKLSQNEFSLDSPTSPDITFPGEPGKGLNVLHIGDTWEVPDQFRMTIHGISKTLPDGIICDIYSPPSFEYRTEYLSTNLKNLSSQNLGKIFDGYLLSDQGELIENFFPCRKGEYEDLGPGMERDEYFALAVPVTSSRLAVFIPFGSPEQIQYTTIDLGTTTPGIAATYTPTPIPIPETWVTANLMDVQITEDLNSIPSLGRNQVARNGWQFAVVTYSLENMTEYYLGSSYGLELSSLFGGDTRTNQFDRWKQYLEIGDRFIPQLLSSEGNAYDHIDSSWFIPNTILPPHFRLKMVDIYEVPKNQTEFRLLFSDGQKITPLELPLDGVKVSNPRFPTEKNNQLSFSKPGDTWEVENVFRFTINRLERDNPSGEVCVDRFNNPIKPVIGIQGYPQVEMIFLRTTVENLTGNDIDLSLASGIPGIPPGLVFTDVGKTFPGIMPCITAGSQAHILPPGAKQEQIYYTVVPMGARNLWFMVGYLPVDKNNSRSEWQMFLVNMEGEASSLPPVSPTATFTPLPPTETPVPTQAPNNP